MGKKYALKTYLKDMTLNQLVEMPIEEREKVLHFLNEKGRVCVFDKTKTLSRLLKIKKRKDPLAKKNDLVNHMIKFPEGRFWEQAEYKHYLFHEHESLVDCLVSTRGDVVWLNRTTGELNVHSSLDECPEIAEKNKLKYIQIGIKGVNVFVARLVCSTFIPYPERTNPADLMVIHKNKDKGDDRWSNLKWDRYSGPQLEGGGYLTEIIEGPYAGKKFYFRDTKFVKLDISKTEILNVLAGFAKSARGCVFTKVSWRNINKSEMSPFKELVQHLKTCNSR